MHLRMLSCRCTGRKPSRCRERLSQALPVQTAALRRFAGAQMQTPLRNEPQRRFQKWALDAEPGQSNSLCAA